MAGIPEIIRYTLISSTKATLTKPQNRNSPCIAFSIKSFFFFILRFAFYNLCFPSLYSRQRVPNESSFWEIPYKEESRVAMCPTTFRNVSALFAYRNGTGVTNQICRIFRCCEIVELLCFFGKLSVFLGDEAERTLQLVASIFDGVFGASYAVNLDSLNLVLTFYCGEGSVSDCFLIAAYCGDYRTCGCQFLFQLALVFGAGCTFETVSRTGSCFSADAGDLSVFTADLAPVCDLSAKNVCYLLSCQILYTVVCIDDYGDSVQCDDLLFQSVLLVILQCSGCQADVGVAVLGFFDSGTGSGWIVCYLYAFVILLLLFRKCTHHFLHGSGSVRADRCTLFLAAAASCESSHTHQTGQAQGNQFEISFFHLSLSFAFFPFSIVFFSVF